MIGEAILIGLLFFAFGVCIYALDALIVRVLKTRKGMVIGRHLQAKLLVAAIFMALKWYVTERILGSKAADSHLELVYLLVEWIVVLIGLYFGPSVSQRAPGFFKKLFAYANAIEAGQANPLKDLGEKLDTKNYTAKVTIEQKKEERVIVEEPKEVPKTDSVPQENVIEQEVPDTRTPQKKMADATKNFTGKNN